MLSRHASDTTDARSSGTLYVVSTPIGNLSDITLRALETLRNADLIAAEDTRHTRKLLTHYDIHKPLTSYHSYNMTHRGPQLVQKLLAGDDIALVSDAGTPGVSDPGALLVADAIEAEIPVVVIPGPAALLMALVASGLPTHSFTFLGFAPTRGAGRKRFFLSHAGLPMTLILYESPRRLLRTLRDMLTHWGDRRMAIARELTKQHEEIFRGTVSEALHNYRNEVKGELTLVVSGEEDEVDKGADGTDWKNELADLLETPGMTLKKATEEISAKFDISRRTVYQEALKAKQP
jgi:16S rRNA (cytidine1402-2'-O)-methyltransferase